MTWVKICGTTSLEDALTAVDAGADALGFVFYEKSPRNIAPERAREIVARLPGRVEKVGVFVDRAEIEQLRTMQTVGLTAIQHTHQPSPDPASRRQPLVAIAGFQRPTKVYWSFSMSGLLDDDGGIEEIAANFSRLFENVPEEHPSVRELFGTFLLDSGTLQQPGGTGKAFAWAKAVPIAQAMKEGGIRLVVAGGLTPDNVGEAMRILKPWGVDVSSGVESAPGKKDPDKVRAFIDAVRQADKEV